MVPAMALARDLARAETRTRAIGGPVQVTGGAPFFAAPGPNGHIRPSEVNPRVPLTGSLKRGAKGEATSGTSSPRG